MKNKVTIVLILLAVALIAFLGGFALRDCTTTKQTSTNKSAVDNTTSVKGNHTLQEALKIVDSYSRIFVNAKTLSELSKEDLQILIFNKAFERKNETISLENYEKAIKNSPFNTITFEPTDISFDIECKGITLYKYNSESKAFEYQESGGHDCGFGSFPIQFEGSVYDFKVENNQYILTEYAVYFRNLPENKINFYGSYEDAEKEQNPIETSEYLWFIREWNENDLDFNSSKTIVDKYLDKVTKLTFTFEDKDGVLTLVDYKATK